MNKNKWSSQHFLYKLNLGLSLFIFVFNIQRSTILARTRTRYCQLFLQSSAVFAYQIDNDTHVFLHLTALTIIHLIPVFYVKKKKKNKIKIELTIVMKYNKKFNLIFHYYHCQRLLKIGMSHCIV